MKNIYSQEEYAVYMVVYFGRKLPKKSENSLKTPRRYVGSSKVCNILNGYLGSVTSKKYSKLWNAEINENRSLFKIKILSYHKTDVEAREEEKRIQIKYNVVKSDLYVNLALASPNGYFGKPDTGRQFNKEAIQKMSIVRKGRTYEEIFGIEKAKELREARRNQNAWNKGKSKNNDKSIKKYGEKMSKIKSGGYWITNGIEDKYISDATKIIPKGWKNGRTNGNFQKHEIQCLTCKKIIKGSANFNSHIIRCDFILQENKRKYLVEEILFKTTKKQRKSMKLGGMWRTQSILELEKILQKINQDLMIVTRSLALETAVYNQRCH
jgi:hypothetical protein